MAGLVQVAGSVIYRGLVVTLVAVAFLMVSPLSLASAQAGSANAEATALLERGTELRRAGRDEEALELFKRADGLHPTPRAHAQVALAEQALGRWVAAEKDLSQALASADDPWIEKNRAVLESALAAVRTHLGRLIILGSPANAVVSVNGERIGRLPLASPVAVAAGDVLANVEADGYMTVSRKVAVSAGQFVRETIDLPSTSPSPARIAAQAPMVRSDPNEPAPPPRLGTQRILALAAAGVGVVGLGLGIGFGLDAMSKRNAARSVCPGECPDQNGVNLWNQARTAGDVSTITFIVGGLGVAGAAALWLTGRPESPGAATQIGLGPGSVILRGRW